MTVFCQVYYMKNSNFHYLNILDSCIDVKGFFSNHSTILKASKNAERPSNKRRASDQMDQTCYMAEVVNEFQKEKDSNWNE